jgi:membrane carboxypeptidase/penicillin-binding protein PbpC
VLPSAVTAWLVERERSVPETPTFAADCPGDPTGAPPSMVTPADGQIVTLIPGMPTKKQAIPLSASTRAATVSWFVDGALVATAPATERVFWTPIAGKHEIVVADEAGRVARRTLEVRATLR